MKEERDGEALKLKVDVEFQRVHSGFLYLGVFGS